MVRMAVIDVVQPDVMFDSLDIDHSGLVTIEEILLLGNVVDAPFVLWSPEQFREAAGTPADARSFNQEQFLKWFASVKDSWTVEAEDMRMLIDGGHNARAQADPYNHECATRTSCPHVQAAPSHSPCSSNAPDGAHAGDLFLACAEWSRWPSSRSTSTTPVRSTSTS